MIVIGKAYIKYNEKNPNRGGMMEELINQVACSGKQYKGKSLAKLENGEIKVCQGITKKYIAQEATKFIKKIEETYSEGLLLPLIYLIYSLLPKDPQHKPIIVIIVSVIIAIIYLLIACDKHECCIQCELEIDESERQYDKE